MMSKDWRSAILAVLLALPVAAATGSARAESAAVTVIVGVGIDHTQRARIGAAQGWLGASDAIDLLHRPATQRIMARPDPKDAAAPPVGGLRGLPPRGWLDGATVLTASGRPDGEVTGPRLKDRPMPYMRFGEGEQVFGFSFKIQPPAQAPEASSPGS